MNKYVIDNAEDRYGNIIHGYYRIYLQEGKLPEAIYTWLQVYTDMLDSERISLSQYLYGYAEEDKEKLKKYITLAEKYDDVLSKSDLELFNNLSPIVYIRNMKAYSIEVSILPIEGGEDGDKS